MDPHVQIVSYANIRILNVMLNNQVNRLSDNWCLKSQTQQPSIQIQLGLSCRVYKFLEFLLFIPWCKTIQKGDWMQEFRMVNLYDKFLFLSFCIITIKVEHKMIVL